MRKSLMFLLTTSILVGGVYASDFSSDEQKIIKKIKESKVIQMFSKKNFKIKVTKLKKINNTDSIVSLNLKGEITIPKTGKSQKVERDIEATVLDNGTHIIMGNPTKLSKTSMRIENFFDLNLINKKSAAFILGTGKEEILAFIDPNCYWCKKLEKHIDKNNLEDKYKFLVYFYPFDNKDDKELYILSGKNNAERVKRYKEIKNKSITEEQLQSKDIKGSAKIKLKNQQKLGSLLKITGTPTIFKINKKNGTMEKVGNFLKDL